MHFSAKAEPRLDSLLRLRIRNSSVRHLNQTNPGLFDELSFELDQPQKYGSHRDYLRSSINVLRRHGIYLAGANIELDSDIPIGKGMCSSSTMILAFQQALLSLAAAAEAAQPERVAELAWEAEVQEFSEPGGRMDHYASALGGIVHLDFSGKTIGIERLSPQLEGCFILFDTLEPKDTLRALHSAKQPTLSGLHKLAEQGIHNLPELARHPRSRQLLDSLPAQERRCLQANLENYRIFREALRVLRSPQLDEKRFGELITAHHRQLADGLQLSTPKLEQILDIALACGAWGGKLNGSGGGGCLYVYAPWERKDEIIARVAEAGYPGRTLRISSGLHSVHV